MTSPDLEHLLLTELHQAILYHPDAIEALSTSDVGWPFCDVNRSDVRHFVELFKAEGAAGQYEEEWLQDAIVAGREHAEGKFDEMMMEKFKEEWARESGEEYPDSEDDGEDKKDTPTIDGMATNNDNLESGAREENERVSVIEKEGVDAAQSVSSNENTARLSVKDIQIERHDGNKIVDELVDVDMQRSSNVT